MKKRYVSAKEAAEQLNISMPTLYAYVSRGLIRSEPDDESTRRRRYYAEDIEALLLRKEASKSPEAVAGALAGALAESALHWGVSSMESEITLILDGHLYYRGRDVAALVEEMSFEQVAALLWSGEADHAGGIFEQEVAPLVAGLPTLPPTVGLLPYVQSTLTLLGADDLAAYSVVEHMAIEPMMIIGGRILLLLTHLLTSRYGQPPKTDFIAARLAAAWCPHQPHAADLINMALILCADHELNASSFTARVVTSTGATLYQVVNAGLSALQGVKHGGYTERVVANLHQLNDFSTPKSFLADRLKRGETIPGFGHKLYPDGDPRAHLLMARIEAALGEQPSVQQALTLAREYHAITGEYPTIDFALGMLERGLELPESGALALFALGRTAGWIAHAIEQGRDGRLIRPRAKYTGIQPETGE